MSAVKKGRSFENSICRKLNQWAGDNFFHRRGLGKKGSDIIPPKEFPFSIECKCNVPQIYPANILFIHMKQAVEQDVLPPLLFFSHKKRLYVGFEERGLVILSEYALKFKDYSFFRKDNKKLYVITAKDFFSAVQFENLF